MTILENTFQPYFLPVYILIQAVPGLLILSSVLQAFGIESVFANKSYKLISIIHLFPSTYGSRPSYPLHCFQAKCSQAEWNILLSGGCIREPLWPLNHLKWLLNTKEQWLNYIPRHLPSSQWVSHLQSKANTHDQCPHCTIRSVNLSALVWKH